MKWYKGPSPLFSQPLYSEFSFPASGRGQLYWLQLSEELRNKCGFVTRSLCLHGRESQKRKIKGMALPLIICMEASKYLLFLGPVTAAALLLLLLLRWSFSAVSLIKYSAVVWSKIWKKSPAPSEKSSKTKEAVSTTMPSTVAFFMAGRKL